MLHYLDMKLGQWNHVTTDIFIILLLKYSVNPVLSGHNW